MNSKNFQLLIITGLSGAGKTTASHFYEDSGYFCMDNVPPVLLPQVIDVCLKSNESLKKLAVVIDARGGSFFEDLFTSIEIIKEMGIKVRILFLEAAEDALIRRFSETRRKHPLNKGGRVNDDIRNEKTMLSLTREKADFIIDTTNINGRELQEQLRQFSEGVLEPRSMSVVFVSFGFKYGVPLDCDLVFDVRFLPNPFYVDTLKSLTGKDKPVNDYIFSSEVAKQYAQRLVGFIEFQIPQFINEPKTKLQIGIGCTGGKHRSVAFAEYLYNTVTCDNIRKHRIHRDVDKK
ncbi:MAG: RNase adapter RapZ [Candidatus Riflebacteria bacterium]|nr:RNase adapter RapZ [Candidatus Riflebacteria bacterium]